MVRLEWEVEVGVKRSEAEEMGEKKRGKLLPRERGASNPFIVICIFALQQSEHGSIESETQTGLYCNKTYRV